MTPRSSLVPSLRITTAEMVTSFFGFFFQGHSMLPSLRDNRSTTRAVIERGGPNSANDRGGAAGLMGEVEPDRLALPRQIDPPPVDALDGGRDVLRGRQARPVLPTHRDVDLQVLAHRIPTPLAKDQIEVPEDGIEH